MRKQILVPILLAAACPAILHAQTKIKDGTVTGTGTLPNSAAILELESSNKGLLLPRVALTNTTTWGLTGTATAGMMVYDTATSITSTDANYPILAGGKGTYYWDGTGWVGMKPTAESDWHVTGNAGTNPAGGTSPGTDFLGTTDNQDFQIKVGTSAYNNIMRVKNGNGHVQFGNWFDYSTSPNMQNPDKFQTGASIGNQPSSFAVAANFAAADISGMAISNFRSAAYVNAASSVPFFSNLTLTQFNNGYTAAIAGHNNQIRLDGIAQTYTTSGVNLIAGSQTQVSLLGSATATTAAGTVGITAAINNGSGSTINGPVYAVLGRTITSGTYNGPVIGIKGSLESASTYSNTGSVTGTQGILSQGTFNGNTIGAEGSITGGTFGPNTISIGLHSNLAATGIAKGYGVYVEDVQGTASQFGLYQAGANDTNYLAGKTGIGTATPNSTLQVNGSVSTAIVTTNTSYNLTINDYTVIYTGGAVAPTFTLPDPATCKGRMYRLVNAAPAASYQDVTLSRPVSLYSGQTTTTLSLDTYAADPLASSRTQNTALIQSDGVVWWRIGL